jgi:hypothetical protein
MSRILGLIDPFQESPSASILSVRPSRCAREPTRGSVVCTTLLSILECCRQQCRRSLTPHKRARHITFDIRILAGSLVQFPIFGMLYTAIRSSLSAKTAFLWIRSLASPDFYLTMLIVALTGVSACLMPSASEQTRGKLIAIQVVVTFFLVWKLATGLSLYWLSSSAVTVFQTLWLRYRSDTHSRVA